MGDDKMKHAILIDFGSTFTKVAVTDIAAKRIIYTAKFPSTVRTDARIGLKQCFDAATSAIGKQAFESAVKLSSSSAAGGLRMAVIGLTLTLSNTAGRNAAFGAGAKILQSFSGKITEKDIQSLEESDLEIILFCGGYENGNSSTVLYNAKMLSQSKVTCPVIYAGNSTVATTVRTLLAQYAKECFIVSNIIPNVGLLNTKPTESIIRDVFMKRIVNMKGLGNIQDSIDQVLMPTPAAVLEAGELLSRGCKTQAGLGPMMIVDIGGATTDIHTYVEHTAFEGARMLGAVEPYTKRTVEGDMGMRESSICLLREIGCEAMAKKIGISSSDLEDSINKRVHTTSFLADTEIEKRIEETIASGAAWVSARRHGGHIEHVHSSNCTAIQVGKNLTEIHTIIGTGGPLINSENPRAILENVLADKKKEQDVLLPQTAEFFLDADYILYAAGLLRHIDEDLALTVMKNSLQVI
ncbi:MAG: glutamate mutase L [Angelakisella sp.]